MGDVKVNIDRSFLLFIGNTVMDKYVIEEEPFDIESVLGDYEFGPKEKEIIERYVLEMYYGMKRECKMEMGFREKIEPYRDYARMIAAYIVPLTTFVIGNEMTQNPFAALITGLLSMHALTYLEVNYRGVSALLAGVPPRRYGEDYSPKKSIDDVLKKLGK